MLRADQLSACTPEAVSPGVASCNTHARRSTPFALRNLLGQTLAARTFNFVFCFFLVVVAVVLFALEKCQAELLPCGTVLTR